MRIPRHLSGKDVVNVLTKNLQYRIEHQRGSHIILETEEPSHHRIVVPDHRSIRIGTLKSILKAEARHKGLAKEDLISFF